MLTIDGQSGEGGGQILRTSLALSLVTGEPVRLTHIRAGRAKPGLLRQHLTAVRAAGEVGRAEISGAELGSREITFRPRGVVPGSYRFSTGGAGSTTLVFQTVLPALLRAKGPSELVLEGGTHNPLAPPFDFLELAFLPLVRRLGPRVSATLDAHGFYPAGGGRFRVAIEPAPLGRLEVVERGAIRRQLVRATVQNLPARIAIRELETARAALGWGPEHLRPEVLKGAPGPGNVVTIEIESEHVTEVFTGFGEKGVRAEVVAERAAAEARAYLDAGVAAGEYLADQLLLPLSLGEGGVFTTLEPSSHTRTQIDLLERVLGARTRVTELGGGAFRIVVEPGSRLLAEPC